MAQTPKTPATQLYLVLELASGEPSIERLAPLFDGALVPSLLIVPDANRAPDTASLQALIAVAQHAGVAVLIADDEKLSAEVGADGVHISAAPLEQSSLDRYQNARQTLGPNAIIGVDAGASRHDAMALGEAGADYIAFGSIDSAVVADDPEQPGETQLDIVSWWAEIFQIPIVVLDIADDEAANRFARTGADFIARNVPAGISTADLRDWLLKSQAAIASELSAG